jgi:hypothetical protein
MRLMGYHVATSDILDGQDFLKTHLPPVPGKVVHITNPPYSIKNKWIAQCYNHWRNLGIPFALLLPLDALGSGGRIKMYSRTGQGLQIIVPNARIDFLTYDGKDNGAWFPVAWFTWGFNLVRDLNFYDIMPSKKKWRELPDNKWRFDKETENGQTD